MINTVAGNGTAGYSGDGVQATAAELSSPDGVAVDSSGEPLIADTGNNCDPRGHRHRRDQAPSRATAAPAPASAMAARPPPPCCQTLPGVAVDSCR